MKEVKLSDTICNEQDDKIVEILKYLELFKEEQDSVKKQAINDYIASLVGEI